MSVPRCTLPPSRAIPNVSVYVHGPCTGLAARRMATLVVVTGAGTGVAHWAGPHEPISTAADAPNAPSLVVRCRVTRCQRVRGGGVVVATSAVIGAASPIDVRCRPRRQPTALSAPQPAGPPTSGRQATHAGGGMSRGRFELVTKGRWIFDDRSPKVLRRLPPGQRRQLIVVRVDEGPNPRRIGLRIFPQGPPDS